MEQGTILINKSLSSSPEPSFSKGQLKLTPPSTSCVLAPAVHNKLTPEPLSPAHLNFYNIPPLQFSTSPDSSLSSSWNSSYRCSYYHVHSIWGVSINVSDFQLWLLGSLLLFPSVISFLTSTSQGQPNPPPPPQLASPNWLLNFSTRKTYKHMKFKSKLNSSSHILKPVPPHLFSLASPFVTQTLNRLIWTHWLISPYQIYH